MDSFDRTSFTRDALLYSKNSMLFFYDFKGIHLVHQPDHVKWFPKVIKFPWLKNRTILDLLLPFLWIIFFSTFLLLSAIICIVYRPKICLTENTWVGAVFGIARKIGLCKIFIYCSGDWLANQGNKGYLSRLANNHLFVYMDYIASVTSDLTNSYSKRCNEARELHWGKKVSKNIHHRYPPPIEIFSDAASAKRIHICFLGQVLLDSGLDLILPLLPELHRENGTKLKIIGPDSTAKRIQIEKTIKNKNLESLTELYGYLPENEIKKAMSDCFCGINLITTAESYSSFAVPGKFIYSLQLQSPVLTTKNNGLVEVIEENKLGIIIEPNPRLILSSIYKLYNDQEVYKINISKYAKKHSYLSIKDYLKIIQESK